MMTTTILTKERVALIDADTLIFVAAYYNREQEHYEDMLNGVDSMINEVLINTGASKYCGFMKGKDSSHRHKMFPDYKANRPPAPPWLTKWRPIIEDRLLNHWKFEYVNGVEVDDAVASAHYKLTTSDKEAIICSVDKDFNQIPGLHYNPKTKLITDVTLEQSYDFLHQQILTGDITDNIKGIPGIGPAKAKKILEGGVQSRVEKVIQAYCVFHQDYLIGLTDFSENVIKIVLKVDKYFQFALNEVPEGIKQLQQKEIPL